MKSETFNWCNSNRNTSTVAIVAKGKLLYHLCGVVALEGILQSNLEWLSRVRSILRVFVAIGGASFSVGCDCDCGGGGGGHWMRSPQSTIEFLSFKKRDIFLSRKNVLDCSGRP
ncbi:hypothetical protein M0804_009377 [Polistes exclamans]|nr:hypothetical protein M0804_009377 [Polistes exclamans]